MHRLLAVPVLFSLAAGLACAAADQGLLALVPANSNVVSSIDVQQARNSPLGQFLLSKANANGQGLDQMAQETGFDPRRDLQSVLFASAGPAATRSQSSFVVLMRGNFDTQRIKNLVLSHGGTVQSSGGVDVYVSTKHGENSAFALPDVGVAVMGDLASVEQVIANRANPTTLNPDLQDLIAKVSSKNDAWFASILAGSYLASHINSATNQQVKPQAQALQSIRQAAGGVHFGNNIQFNFDAVTRSPQDATSLVDVFRFMASMFQMQRQNGIQAQAVAAALDNMTLNAIADHFHASLAIPEATMEQLADSAPASHHGFKSANPSQK